MSPDEKPLATSRRVELRFAPRAAGAPGRGLPRPLKHYAFVDFASQGYLTLVALIVLSLHRQALPYWPLFVVAHVIVVGVVHALIQLQAAHPTSRLLDFLRSFYPVILYTGLYRETAALNHLLLSGFLDPTFIRLDARLFGMQPSLGFMNALPYLSVSELFYAVYFSYYVMIAGVGLALFFRDRRQFSHYVSVTSFVFYVCYLIYILTPVAGPHIFFPNVVNYDLPADVQPAVPPTYPATVQSGIFFHVMGWIYRAFEAPGAAFPSSHVAIAFTTVFFSFRYLRRIRWPHLAAAILLCPATVYCRYHYGVDVVAGCLIAAILIPLGNKLYFGFAESGVSSTRLRQAALTEPRP